MAPNFRLTIPIIADKPIVGITMGDYNGIGPEVILKSLTQDTVWRKCNPLLIGSIDVFAWYARKLRMRGLFQEVSNVPKRFGRSVIAVLQPHQFHSPKMTVGKVSKEAGAEAGEALETAVELCQNGAIDAIVTAPVSKEALHKAGYRYGGQTEMLAALTGAKKVTMMLLADTMRIGLVTVHIPIRQVAKEIRQVIVREKISTIYHSLQQDFALRFPKIAVLGLNPHAGERGILGDEEMNEILPAIRFARKKKMRVEGPFSADGFFGSEKFKEYDGIVAMYHDQGLIPLKLMGFDVGVNFSAGLPIVRTSPDHGTAFDIAGKGIANPSSMIEAMLLAVKIFQNRKGT